MIVVVNFSNRKHGNCYSIAGTVKKHYNDKKVKIFNFIDETFSPCGSCNYECYTNKCSVNDSLKEIFKSILQSEETIFIIPNYCDYPSSNFFLFNERCHGFMRNNEELHKRYEDDECRRYRSEKGTEDRNNVCYRDKNGDKARIGHLKY